MLEPLRNMQVNSASELQSAFAQVADDILLRGMLLVYGQRCRILEIEFYCHSTWHADPFVHCHPLQSTFGRWYFHRIGNGYRGGTFKGVDISIGTTSVFGGILIRTIETEKGQLVCGPSLCVDHFLDVSGFQSVRALDKEIAHRNVCDQTCPLRLSSRQDRQLDTVYQSARVGLSATRHARGDLGQSFLNRPYRFLVQPRKIKKGRAELIKSLAKCGHSVNKIQSLTGSTASVIERYLAR